jgi:acid stress chaperone HdeB
MRIVRAAVLGLALCAGVPASAQTVDVSTIKCGEFLQSGQESMTFVIMWLDGYYSAEDADAVIDFAKMKPKTERLVKYCQDNPGNGLITAADEVFAK